MLRRPLPRLTKWGFSVCTFSPLPVSIRSRGLFCRGQRRGQGCLQHPLSPAKLGREGADPEPGAPSHPAARPTSGPQGGSLGLGLHLRGSEPAAT